MFPQNITTQITLYKVIPQVGRTPEHLQRTVIDGVFWDIYRGVSYGKKTATEQDTATLMIPPMEITFSPGDYVVKGVGGDISNAAELTRTYPDAVVITRVRDCRYGSPAMWHWEVDCK